MYVFTINFISDEFVVVYFLQCIIIYLLSLSLARGKAAAVTRESGEVVACSLARERRQPDGSHLQLGQATPGQRENTETVAKQKQPHSAGLDAMRGAPAQKIT